MRRHDGISINRYEAFSETALGKSGPCGAAIAQFIGLRCQVSGVRELRCEILKPRMKLPTFKPKIGHLNRPRARPRNRKRFKSIEDEHEDEDDYEATDDLI